MVHDDRQPQKEFQIIRLGFLSSGNVGELEGKFVGKESNGELGMARMVQLLLLTDPCCARRRRKRP